MGIKLYYLLLLSSVLNLFLKEMTALPRPCNVNPSVGMVCSSSFGFPSGGAQTAMILSGVIFLETKNRLIRVLGVIFALFLCFSRVYLGMHYPTDILGGLIVGGILLVLYKNLFPLCEKRWQAWAFILPICTFILAPKHLYASFGPLGVAVGLWCYEKAMLKEGKSLYIKEAQALVVIVGLFLFKKVDKFFPGLHYLFPFLSGLWISFLVPWAAARLSKSG